MKNHLTTLDKITMTIKHAINNYNFSVEMYSLRSVETAAARIRLNTILDTLELTNTIDEFEVNRCDDSIFYVRIYLGGFFAEIREDDITYGNTH